MLLEPGRWQRVQLQVGPDDFTDDLRRRLAEVYWNYQRDEGEPAFSELLSMLADWDQNQNAGVSSVELRELAIEVTDEVEAFSASGEIDFEATLSGALQHLQHNLQSQEKQKLIASIRRTSDQTPGSADEVDLLQRLMDQVKGGAKKPPL